MRGETHFLGRGANDSVLHSLPEKAVLRERITVPVPTNTIGMATACLRGAVTSGVLREVRRNTLSGPLNITFVKKY